MEEILSKVYKDSDINLKSELIALSDFADIKTQLERADKSHATILDFSNKLFNLKNEAKKILPKELESLNRYQKELESDLTKFVARLKTLGIEPNEVKQPKQYDDAIKRIATLEGNAQKMYQDFK